MLNNDRIKNEVPETRVVNDIRFNFIENKDPNIQYRPEVKSNVQAITEWTVPTMGKFGTEDVRFSVKISDDVEVPDGFIRQNGFKDGKISWWGISDLDQLNGFIEQLDTFDSYPPAIHGERKWTEEILADDDDLIDELLKCVGTEPANRIRVRPERRTPEGNRIDLYIKNGVEHWSVEAMDSRGVCDDAHFDKGMGSYPMAIREMNGFCTGAIIIAAEFTPAQIQRAGELHNTPWQVALVKAEEIDNHTKFTLIV